MHKKLFGLLATAVVGLTLTSCGGGGGGGGGEGSGENVGEEIIDSITGSVNSEVPASLVGKTLSANLKNSTKTETYYFATDSTVENHFVSTTGKNATLSGNYKYTPKLGGEAYLEVTLYNSSNDYSFKVTLNFENGKLIGFTPESGYARMWSSVYMN